jgi:para-aminobenzoate synthetase component 1
MSIGTFAQAPPTPRDPAGAAVVERLCPAPDTEQVFTRLSRLPHCVFLDSALRDPRLGRYSFVAADPFDYIEIPPDRGDPLRTLAERLRGLTACHHDDLPPFQGGAAGLLSYDLGRSLEKLPLPAWDEFAAPALAVGLYDVVVAFDHATDSAWIVSQGLPELDPQRRRRRAAQRAGEMRRWMLEPAGDMSCPPRCNTAMAGTRKLDHDDLCPQYPVTGLPGLTSNFTEAAYLQTVQHGIDYIFAGDIFQVNLAQRLLYPARDDSISLYRRLRKRNPATFAAYFDLGEFQIVSASPERFLHVSAGRVETRPIKGTRPRTHWPESDLFAACDLQESIKDRAENVMIVDLLRNDLSRVCTADSVRVLDLCRVEVYQTVQHLVSVIEGTLEPENTPLDLVRAAFPGGSITGAPKVRAMEIIAELEPTARGPYCGCLGYLGFDGTLDLSILIRTITAGRGWWQLPVGGGIVAQSVPEREYEETWHKAAGLIRALEP